ncbi:endonuclease III [Candidatus Roizmanbacteria bacterium CG10_big_fil_rev_8_21_14_0_10_39_12]|uniref:Endonuclease III n=1 Tax=Candidatus Roizmanbacteria bacterium CG10_big_fil_rev_8_21_14_0_10_39_12 TaxID=1974852 RepID=A0A2M8KQ52_9BACT|nr:MAG: endonuclease III [Candidatus Roizmanbacteria bacterium CG10_big_fil_rev_8_21_14_0_10_39_12]
MNIKEKRATIIVQTLKALFPKIQPSLHFSNPFEFLVAVILSAQCTDARVNIVTRDLFKKYTSVKDFAGASQEEFEQDIRSTGFYRNKAKNILATSHIIHEKYDDQVPKTMGELLELPGVARKTANVVLGYEFGVVEGVAVDTHVKRLSNLYGLTTEQNPIKIEQDLMKVLPKSEWVEYTMRMVEYGRKYCPASKHDHAHCPITMALTEAKLDPKSQQQ